MLASSANSKIEPGVNISRKLLGQFNLLPPVTLDTVFQSLPFCRQNQRGCYYYSSKAVYGRQSQNSLCSVDVLLCFWGMLD